MQSFQVSRHELKYLVTESQASAVRSEIQGYLCLDRNMGEDKNGYRVQSLYLDSRDSQCYNETLCGNKNRFKLRMRFYDDSPTSPVFLEIKRRVTVIVQKKRAAVSRQAALDLLKGHGPSPSMLLKDGAAQRDGLESFCRLRDQLAAVGKVFVDYQREAWEGAGGNQYRVTFDRNVRGSFYVPGSGLTLPPQSALSGIQGVVLEMKYTNRPAPWMNEIASRHNLQPVSVPKYVECVDVTLGAQNNQPWSGSLIGGPAPTFSPRGI